jgi:hypothetical protein
MANCLGRDPAGLAVWRLTVNGDDVPRRWVIVDREFRPASAPSPEGGAMYRISDRDEGLDEAEANQVA